MILSLPEEEQVSKLQKVGYSSSLQMFNDCIIFQTLVIVLVLGVYQKNRPYVFKLESY